MFKNETGHFSLALIRIFVRVLAVKMIKSLPAIKFQTLYLMNQEFETYLSEKLIDSQAFKLNEPSKWQSFKELFEKVHPNSFTVQKKFLINDLRRIYHLKVEKATNVSGDESGQPNKPAKPVIRRAPIIKKPEA